METIADPRKIVYNTLNLLEHLPVFGPQNDNFGMSIVFNKINAFHHSMGITYIGNNQFTVDFRYPPNRAIQHIFVFSKENLLKTLRTLTKKFIIGNIDFNSTEHANTLFACSTRNCLSVQNFYANKFIKPKVDKIRQIKAAKVIQRRAVIRYNNPARPNVRARHLREISELKNLNLNKEIKNKIKLLEFGKRK